ncbi:MAG: ABC transporter ATP-binding protein [Anaerolineales bacterium]
MSDILQVEHVTKRFGGLQALTNITFHLAEGEILGLIGPNGAGKTTLFNTINGVYTPEEGRITFLGKNVTGHKPYELAKMGMARTHQIVRPLKELTVRENILAGACFGHENHNLLAAGRIADEMILFAGITSSPDQLAGSLNVAQKKRLEMARALAAHPKLLLLDEVLAGLTPSEIDGMVKTILDIRKQGITIIMIEHVMKAIMNVSDHLLVLDYGQQIAEGLPEEVVHNERVVEAYLGDPNMARKLMEEDEHGAA